ncbi:MAG: hypothetical protein WB985_04130 [Candidatus Acidiferrales bacterium]
MRPRHALLVAAVFALGAASRPLHSQELAWTGLNGPVHAVRTEFFSDATAAPDKPTYSDYQIYDTRGFMQEMFHDPHDGTHEDHSISTHVGNKLFRYQVIGSDPADPWQTYTEEFAYDAEGREIESDRYDRNGVFFGRSITTYTDTANIHARIKTTSSLGQPDKVDGSASVTDPVTGLTSQTTTEGGVTTTDWRYVPVSIDGAGAASKRVMPDGSYLLTLTQPDGIKTYDRYDAKKNRHSYSKVDAAGHLVESTQFRDSQWLRTTYTWDEKGRSDAQITYDQDGTISGKITFEYVDDARGNWIEMREHGMDLHAHPTVPQTWEHLTRRTITYF